jgi:hypothetical protein
MIHRNWRIATRDRGATSRVDIANLLKNDIGSLCILPRHRCEGNSKGGYAFRGSASTLLQSTKLLLLG